MNVQHLAELGKQIQQLQALMMAFVTDGRTPDQPAKYRELYAEIQIALELAKYPHPNPHKSLEVFWSYCKSQEMNSYASRRAYVEDLYADILLDLKRVQARKPGSRNWIRANRVLEDELAPVRAQWLKAKNFIIAPTPDYENSIKEAINSIESCLMVLLNEPNATLGKVIKRAELDEDIQSSVRIDQQQSLCPPWRRSGLFAWQARSGVLFGICRNRDYLHFGKTEILWR